MNFKYRVVKVGGFQIGSYKTKKDAKKAIRGSEYGFYQIINKLSGLAVWEGWN